MRLRQRVFGAGAMSFPTWAYMLFFFIIPVALVVWYSFGYKPDVFTTYSMDHLSFDRYHEAVSSTFLSTFWATLRISLIGTAICLLIGVPFAYWLAVKVPARRRSIMLALVLVPFWTNFLVRTLGWQVILSPSGFLSKAVQAVGLGGPFDILYTRTAVQIGVVYNYLPLMILPLFVSIDRAGKSLREASRDLGAGRWRTLFQVTLPLAGPGIASGCLLIFVPLMGDYITASVLGGAHGTMVAMLVASQFETATNWALGAAMAVVLMLFILATVVLAAIVVLIVKRIIAWRLHIRLPEPTGAPEADPEPMEVTA